MANKGATVPQLAASAVVNGHRSEEYGHLRGHFWTPCRRGAQPSRRAHKRHRKVEQVEKSLVIQKKVEKVAGVTGLHKFS